MNRPIFIISDTHIPFEKKGYLEFCKKQYKEHKCDRVVHIGDLVDNHSISYHEHDPDGWSPYDEMRATDKILAKWFKAFPNVVLTKGNHDCLVDRKGKTIGLPKRCFKPFREIWELPDGWKDVFSIDIQGILFKHGTGMSGQLAHLKAARANRQSTVIGHLPSYAGVEYDASEKDVIFGMNVGCGIDRDKYAFAYGKDFAKKPILGCGIVFDDKNAQFIPMKL